MKPELEALLTAGIINRECRLQQDIYCRLPDVEASEEDKIFGPDTRTLVRTPLQYPYLPIVRLVMDYNGSFFRGTGFLIGTNKIVTAAHCMIIPNTGQTVSNITAFVYPATQNAHCAVCTRCQISPTYATTLAPADDWAVFKVGTNLGNYAGALQIMDCTTLPQGNYICSIAGYPSTVLRQTTAQLWVASGAISFPLNNAEIDHTISTSGGQSGSPVIVYTGGSYRVIGIHVNRSHATNRACPIDAQLAGVLNAY